MQCAVRRSNNFVGEWRSCTARYPNPLWITRHPIVLISAEERLTRMFTVLGFLPGSWLDLSFSFCTIGRRIPDRTSLVGLPTSGASSIVFS
ncbi:unnamed protein product [Nezara viridula]|uniref:Uncharacterized protein n=1 Tax=Nezara viridula TaxID=85310 RepID=A0A9P0HHS8_NEZVI|nr:unnamed protein product [Nezara viridula]